MSEEKLILIHDENQIIQWKIKNQQFLIASSMFLNSNNIFNNITNESTRIYNISIQHNGLYRALKHYQTVTYQLIAGANLLKVLRFDEQQVAQCVKRVEESSDQWHAEFFHALPVLVHVADRAHCPRRVELKLL